MTTLYIKDLMEELEAFEADLEDYRTERDSGDYTYEAVAEYEDAIDKILKDERYNNLLKLRNDLEDYGNLNHIVLMNDRAFFDYIIDIIEENEIPIFIRPYINWEDYVNDVAKDFDTVDFENDYYYVIE